MLERRNSVVITTTERHTYSEAETHDGRMKIIIYEAIQRVALAALVRLGATGHRPSASSAG
jgi:hypothetical protein